MGKTAFYFLRRHDLKIFLGAIVVVYLMLAGIADATPSANVTFVTTGSSFSPIITVTGNPTIHWIFGDGSTSNSTSPNVNFGSSRTRVNTLVVTPWSAVTKINIGYDGSDGGVTPSSSTIANVKQQNVIAIKGLENVAPNLEVWASSYNPVTELDFSNFTVLNTIECFSCTSLATIRLHNNPSLTRLCLEHCNISYLDLSEIPSLADLRGARQGSLIYTINWGTTGTHIWHICVRDNRQMTSIFPFSQFPHIRQLYNWNDNQSGTLFSTSNVLTDVESYNNHYSAALFSGCFPTGRKAVVNIHDNSLTSLEISNDPGLTNLDVHNNLLNQESVDKILQTLDSYKTNNGRLDMTGNAAPSSIGMVYAKSLTAKGWKVQISANNNPPVASFVMSKSSGKAPLFVYFTDKSTGTITSEKWTFGDGATSTSKNPSHKYTKIGKWKVTLNVTNKAGSSSKYQFVTVTK